MEDFHFHDPQYLWALIILPLLFFTAWSTRSIARKRLQQFAKPTALARILTGSAQTQSPLRPTLFYLAISLFILALARPQGNPLFEQQTSAGLDIMVVLDVSRSMDSEDIYPSRLKKAKREINTLLDRLMGDRLGIVAFAGSAVLMTPLTSDYEIIRSYLEAIDTTTIQNQGTNIAEGLHVAISAFQRGGTNGLSPDNHSNLIILMSDGEAHDGSTFDAVKEAKGLGIAVHTIAFGSEKGVPIPIRDAHGQLQSYKRNARGEEVISKVNPQSLKEIASHGEGNFYFSTLDEGEISDIIAHTAKLQRTAKKEIRAKVYEEYFHYLILPGLLLLLISLLPWKISDWRVAKISVFLFALLCSSQVYAEEPNSLPIQSKLWDKNRRLTEEALKKYEEGKYDESTQILQKVQIDNPNSATAAFDLGTSLLKEKKTEEGRATLAEASKSNGLAALAARMNIAGSYAEEKKIPEAQAGYSSIIHDLNSKSALSRDEQALLTQAKKNMELLSSKEQSKQKSEPQKNDKKEEQDKQDKQDQQNKSGSGQPKEDDKKSNPNKQDSEQDKDKDKKEQEQKEKQYSHERQPFQERQELSEQDAKRMLEALRQQEGAAQKKFLKKLEKNSNRKENENGQDW